VKKYFLLSLLGGMTALPIVLLILPPTYFDEGQSTCLSVLLLDKTCPGCGLTRATQHLIHFDFSAAGHFNKLSFLVFPLLVYWYVKEFFKIWKKYRLLS
jgi:hypothetical protein